jgi:hypothetical protein
MRALSHGEFHPGIIGDNETDAFCGFRTSGLRQQANFFEMQNVLFDALLLIEFVFFASNNALKSKMRSTGLVLNFLPLFLGR